MGKTEQVRKLFSEGMEYDALRIGKGFRMGMTKEESRQIVRGWECHTHPDFYRQLGYDLPSEIQKAIDTLKRVVSWKE